MFQEFNQFCSLYLLSDRNTISSAYNEEFTEISPMWTGLQLPVFNSSTMPSMKMLKRQGLKISPCLIPHSDGKDLLRPFANFILVLYF